MRMMKYSMMNLLLVLSITLSLQELTENPKKKLLEIPLKKKLVKNEVKNFEVENKI